MLDSNWSCKTFPGCLAGLSVLSIQPQPHVSKSFITEFLSKQVYTLFVL